MTKQTRTALKGNLIEKYYKANLSEKDLSLKLKEADISPQERKKMRLSILGMGLWLINRAIKILESTDAEEFYPTGLNYIPVPADAEDLKEISAELHKFEEKIVSIANKYKNKTKTRRKLAVLAAVIPYE